jgi:hypothetical protein
MFAAIRPSLMTRDGLLHVFAFETAGRALMYVRFAPGAPPAVARTEAVPGQIVSGGCALSGHEQEGPAVVVVSHDAGIVAVHFGVTDRGGAFGPFRGTQLESVRVIPASTPAVRIDEEGRMRAVLILRDAEQPDEIVRADFVAPLGGDVQVELTKVARMPREPRSARAVYSASDRATPRVHWAVLLEDGSVVSSAAADVLQIGATAVAPLEIVAFSDTAYALAMSEPSGVVLVALR